MPNPHSPSPEPDIKPLPKPRKRAKPDPDSSDFAPSEGDKSKPKTKPKATPSASTSGSTMRGPWTGVEYVQLFDQVMANGTGSKSFAAAVPGRSANQAAMAWRDVVRPKCREMLLAKGKRSH